MMPGYQGLRLAILLAVIVTFAVSAVFSVLRHSETREQLTLSQKTGAWSASELERELLQFNQTLELFGLGERSHDQLMPRFDLLWSRLDTLRVGSETLEVRNLPGAAELLLQIRNLLLNSEAPLFSLRPGDKQQAQRLLEPFRALQPSVRDFNVDSFYVPHFAALKKGQPVQSVGFGLSMLGLLLSGAVLVVLRESARNRVQALHDDLTGLPNRKYFNDIRQQAEINALREQSRLGLLVIDLNNFKEINDTYGHTAGDELLKRVAARLRACVGQSGVAARLGGDEFAVLLDHSVDEQRCSQLARELCDQIGRGIALDGKTVFVTAGIGVSLFPDDAANLRQAMVNADLAMYIAKRDDGVSYRRYEPAMNATLMRRHELAEQLHQAIADSQLNLNYQPVVRLATGQVESVEALLRWYHPQYGYISPLEVVSIAEQYDLALELNEWVIASACQQALIWQSAGLPSIKVAVTISPSMYTKYDLVASVSR